MRQRGALGALLLVACSEASLYPAQRPPAVRDDRLTIHGQFCTEVPQPTEFPVRILFIVDISQSMNITDPMPNPCAQAACFTRRATAVEDILNTYPAGNGVEYGLITFQSSVAIETRDSSGQLGGFTASSDEVKLRLPALNVGVGETNYVGALDTAYEMLQQDMIALDTTARSRARYVIVFISDGLPSPTSVEYGMPDDIRQAVQNIASLQKQQRLAEIAFHTVYLSAPDTPDSVQLQAKELLAEMANLGGGTFRAFDATQRIDLFYIDFTSFIRTFALKQLVAVNLNALPVKGETVVDTDGDGLSDAEEELAGSSPFLVDTDGDGFSDLLEVRQSNAGLDPLFSGDADCRMATDRLDDDGDGLLNCEERYFGTNSRLIDSPTTWRCGWAPTLRRPTRSTIRTSMARATAPSWRPTPTPFSTTWPTFRSLPTAPASACCVTTAPCPDACATTFRLATSPWLRLGQRWGCPRVPTPCSSGWPRPLPILQRISATTRSGVCGPATSATPRSRRPRPGRW